jgi:hypothetical protein
METCYVVKDPNNHKLNMVEYDGYNSAIILCEIYMAVDHILYNFLKRVQES